MLQSIDRYVSIRQAMDFLGVRSRTTFDRRMREWGIAKHKFGKLVRYSMLELETKASGKRAS